LRVFVTGASGVLGRALLPLLEAAGYHVRAPGRHELDLFDARSVSEALSEIEAVYHLATRIPPRERRGASDAWRENDRLRADAARLVVDAALVAGTEVYVQPSVTFVYPTEGEVDEDIPLGDVPPHLESSLAAEREAARFAQAGRRGVVLRLGRLDGPGRNTPSPSPAPARRSTSTTQDARSWQPSRRRAGSTTSSETAGALRMSASSAPPAGDQPASSVEICCRRPVSEDWSGGGARAKRLPRGDELGATVYELGPGNWLPFHFHHGSEEYLVVLRGRPTLRTGEGSRELAEGDALHFPRGPDGAHGLTNETDEPARGADGVHPRHARGRGVPGPQADHRAGADGLADRRISSG
jgi:quercetin dioxygenase-like cupin family protein